jgi:hypothetical protein
MGSGTPIHLIQHLQILMMECRKAISRELYA